MEAKCYMNFWSFFTFQHVTFLACLINKNAILSENIIKSRSYVNKKPHSFDCPLCVFFHGKTTKPPRYNFATIKKDTKSPNKSEEKLLKKKKVEKKPFPYLFVLLLLYCMHYWYHNIAKITPLMSCIGLWFIRNTLCFLTQRVR